MFHDSVVNATDTGSNHLGIVFLWMAFTTERIRIKDGDSGFVGKEDE